MPGIVPLLPSQRGTLAMIRILLVAFTCWLQVFSAAAAEPVTLTAADGVRVFGDVYRAAGAKPPVIVCFHQAESSAAEYAPIAPRLAAAGYTVLAIDQRSGGGHFGGTNRTVAALGASAGYEAALPDLEAALAWAQREARGAPVIVWGSSYSASLVFLLAAAHPRDVSAVVAFSPAEYIEPKGSVAKAAARVGVPVYVDQASAGTRDGDGDEIGHAAAIVRAVKGKDKQQTRLKAPSTHGASMLRADANATGAEAHWQPLLKFLSRFRAS